MSSAEFGTNLDKRLTHAAAQDDVTRLYDFAKPIDRLLFLRNAQEARETGHDYVCADCGCAMPMDDSSELHEAGCPRYDESAYR